MANEPKPMEWVPPHNFKTTVTDITYVRDKLKSESENFQLHTVLTHDNLHALPENCIVLWKKQIDAGLRLPPPPFLRDLANMYKIPLSQMHPSAIRRALTFHILVYNSGYDDTVGLFFQTNYIKRQTHFYSFSARSKTHLDFLQKPPSVDGAFQDKPFIVEIENDSIRNKFGLRYPQLHRTPYLFKHTDSPILTKRAATVLSHLNFASKHRQAKMVELVTDDSILAGSGLFPIFPKEDIGK